jgi:chromosome segregation ATPase
VRSAAELQLQVQLEQGELVRRELAEMERELSDLLPRMNHELKQAQEDLQAAAEVRTRDDVKKDEDDGLLQKLIATERDRDLLKEQLDALIKQSVGIVQELEETRSNMKATEVEKQMQQSKVATLEAQVAGMQQDRISLVQTIESLNQDAQNNNQDLKVATARECELLAHIHESEKKVQDLQAAAEVRTRDDVKKDEDDGLRQKLIATERDRDMLKEQLDALIKQSVDIIQDLEETRSNMRVTEAVKDTAMAQLAQTNAALETLSVEFASLEAEKNVALSSLAEANEALEELAHHLPGGID